MNAVTPPYRWCTLYLDVSDPGLVVAAVGKLLGPGSELDVFPAGGFTVEVHANPDRTGGPHYLDWPVVVEVDAAGTAPDAEMVAFATGLIDHLRRAGLRVAPECDFAAELPAPDVRP